MGDDIMANLVKSPFTIDKTTDGAVFLTADLDSADEWKTMLSYAVPLGTAVEITPVNYIFGNLKATDTTTTITAGSTRILKQNANGTESREIWKGANGIFGDIGDIRKRPQLRVPVMINASQKLVVQVYSLGTTLDSVASDFQVECMQYYEEI
jgi:hypothetical protein